MVDKALVLKKIAGLDLYLEQVREFSGITVAAYRDDWKTQRVVDFGRFRDAVVACLKEI